MWSKWQLGIWKDCKSALPCCWTLDIWQGMQALAQTLTCLLRPCHTILEAMSLLEVNIGGWDRPWITSKTRLLHPSGTTGLGWPVEVSQRIVFQLPPNGTSSSWRPDRAVRCACTSGSVFWLGAISSKFIPSGVDSIAVLESASASRLCLPCTCRILVVNSKM